MTSAQLATLLKEQLNDTRLVVVANREPYIHVRRVREPKGLWARLRREKPSVELRWMRPASGLVTALDPVMRACGGTWIAHGSGSADRGIVRRAKAVSRVPPGRARRTPCAACG